MKQTNGGKECILIRLIKVLLMDNIKHRTVSGYLNFPNCHSYRFEIATKGLVGMLAQFSRWQLVEL